MYDIVTNVTRPPRSSRGTVEPRCDTVNRRSNTAGVVPSARSARHRYGSGMVEPPALPRSTSDITLVVAIGTLAWLTGAAVLFLAHLVGGRPLDVWFATCLVGAGLGALGFGIFTWQRAAARRGSRLAQDGLD